MSLVWLANGLTGELGSQLQSLSKDDPSIALKPLNLMVPVGATRLLHLAARRPVHTIGQQIQSNILYLAQVLKYAEANGVRQFVFFSTASLYAECTKAVITESDVDFKWTDTYTWSKWIGEKMVSRSSIPTKTIVRIPALLEMKSGTNFISRAFEQIRNAQPMNLSYLDRPYNKMISAEEILRFLKATAEFSTPGTFVVNLCVEPVHNLRFLLSCLAEELGRPRDFVESSVQFAPHSVLSTKALRETFGFSVPDSAKTIRAWAQRRLSLLK